MKQLSLIFLLAFTSPAAQSVKTIDSLKQRLQTKEHDTVKVHILNQLSREYWDVNLDSSIQYAEQMLKLCRATHNLAGVGKAYNNMGVAYWYKGSYTEALNRHMSALAARDSAGDKKGVSSSLYNMGLIYDDYGNFPLALEYYLKSLRADEALNDKEGVAQCYNNIGLIYHSQKNYKEALDNLQKSLKIRLEGTDEWALSESYSNIGVVYHDMKNYDEAMKYHLKAFDLRKKIDDKEGIAISHANLGNHYQGLQMYDSAMSHYSHGMEINEQLGYKKKVANLLLSMAEAKTGEKMYADAMSLELKAIALAKEVGANDILAKAYYEAARSYEHSGDFKKAYEYHTMHKQVSDTLFNTNNVRQLTRLQMQYDFDKRETAAKAEQDKKDAMSAAEIKRNKQQKYFLTGGLVMALVFGYWDYRQKKKISQARKRSDELLLNILPGDVAEELKEKGSADAKQFDEVTVMFTDFKGFTQISETLSATELVNEIHTCFKAFDDIIAKHNIEKIKTIGDAYMCAGGLPVKNKTHADDVVKAALEIQKFMQEHLRQRKAANKPLFEIRIGIHTGPVVAGIVGVKKFAYDIWGDTVNIASRMESSGEAGKVNISGATYQLVKNTFSCIHRGKISAKNKGEIDMYFVEA